MVHIDELKIDKFRGLRDATIEGLGQVNLFVGNNNSGKTSVLETLLLFCDPLSWRRWYDTGSQREINSSLVRSSGIVDRITWLFAQGVDQEVPEDKKSISLSASGSTLFTRKISARYEKFNDIINTPSFIRSLGNSLESGEVKIEEREEEIEGIKIHVSMDVKLAQPTLFDTYTNVVETLTFTDGPSSRSTKQRQIPTLPAQMVNPFTHRTSNLTSMLWSEVVEADLKEETIRLLQHFDAAIKDVDFISPSERKQLISIKHAHLGRAPLYAFGDGLRRVFTLATTIPRVRGGFLLIDELETAIHAKALEKTFQWLVKACVDNDVQLFATTHSLEALDIVSDVSRDLADLVVYRLQQEKKHTVAKRFDKAMVLRLREDIGMELRY
jgi:AAA15 family ATPase/GTPase